MRRPEPGSRSGDAGRVMRGGRAAAEPLAGTCPGISRSATAFPERAAGGAGGAAGSGRAAGAVGEPSRAELSRAGPAFPGAHPRPAPSAVPAAVPPPASPPLFFQTRAAARCGGR